MEGFHFRFHYFIPPQSYHACQWVEGAENMKAWATAPLCGGWRNCIHLLSALHLVRTGRAAACSAVFSGHQCLAEPTGRSSHLDNLEMATNLKVFGVREEARVERIWASPGKTEAEYAERSRKWTCNLYGRQAMSTTVRPNVYLYEGLHKAGVVVWESIIIKISSSVLHSVWTMKINKTKYQCLMNILEGKAHYKVRLFSNGWGDSSPGLPASLWLRAVCSMKGEQGVLEATGRACAELWSQHQPLCLCHTERRKDLRRQRQPRWAHLPSASALRRVVPLWRQLRLLTGIGSSFLCPAALYFVHW